ncbi:MAG TPA: hypothetical protein VKD90_02755 [Gemmataceae bacterium]|nr:hypothetical protein [Gemmataceae bacterium]
MKTPTNLGMLLLAVWLIAHGAMTLLKINFSYSVEVMAILALAAGILLLLRR